MTGSVSLRLRGKTNHLLLQNLRQHILWIPNSYWRPVSTERWTLNRTKSSGLKSIGCILILHIQTLCSLSTLQTQMYASQLSTSPKVKGRPKRKRGKHCLWTESAMAAAVEAVTVNQCHSSKLANLLEFQGPLRRLNYQARLSLGQDQGIRHTCHLNKRRKSPTMPAIVHL